ncbi:YkgJ family cysteine cluster protein [Desulfococcaceae bacterium HSG7]|nr:YkgJ family cysteine cluster protein [Desulfococcaceae bacterium HSG7]
METEIFFKCHECGDCCKGYGGVFVTPEDIHAISDYLQTNQDHFVADYCQMSGSKPVIAQGSNGYCIFWDSGLQCTIHPVKPGMCRTWPFINSVLTDVTNWRIMASSCPGIRADVSDNDLKAHIAQKLIKDKK